KKLLKENQKGNQIQANYENKKTKERKKKNTPRGAGGSKFGAF
ncbi:hypothetical protein SAMN05444338_1271, partial [Flavobacterium degerlachei]